MLTPGPACAQLQHVPDIASMGINPDHFRGSGEKPSEERAQKHEHYAAIYNQVGIGLKSGNSLLCPVEDKEGRSNQGQEKGGGGSNIK